jgi:hypothetical protein
MELLFREAGSRKPDDAPWETGTATMSETESFLGLCLAWKADKMMSWGKFSPKINPDLPRRSRLNKAQTRTSTNTYVSL